MLALVQCARIQHQRQTDMEMVLHGREILGQGGKEGSSTNSV